jgi:hypothetical protein
MQAIRTADMVIAVSWGDTEVEKQNIIDGIKRLIECLCPHKKAVLNGVKKRTDFRKSHKKGALSILQMRTTNGMNESSFKDVKKVVLLGDDEDLFGEYCTHVISHPVADVGNLRVIFALARYLYVYIYVYE